MQPCSITLLRHQLSQNMGGGNYLAKVSNSYSAADPNSLTENGGPSNAHLFIDNPTHALEPAPAISASGTYVMDPKVIAMPSKSYLFDEQSDAKSTTSRMTSTSHRSSSTTNAYKDSTTSKGTESKAKKERERLLSKHVL